MTFSRKQAKAAEKNTVQIGKDEIYKVQADRHGKEIVCLGGTLWITQTGDGVDRILHSGDIYQTRLSGDIVVQAIQSATLKATSLSQVEVFGNSPKRIEPQLAWA